MPRLSPELRERALGMLQANMNVTAVARAVGCKRVAIYRLRQRFQQTGSSKDRPRSGRPKVTSPADDRFIRLRHLRNRFLPATSSTHVVQGRRVSARTIRRRLRSADLRCRRPYKGLILTQRHRQERVRWCRARLRWRLNNEWSHILFSDESRFTLLHSDGRARVYRRQNERFADSCVQEHDRFGGGSVMIWGGITARRRTNLVFVEGNLTAVRYRDNILATEVVNFLNQNGPGITFQHDNARPHTARVTQAFLQQQNIDVVPWPSKSPDLNPIEHIWDELNRRVRNREQKPQNLVQLRQALQDEWNNMPQAVISRVAMSMRHRLQAVINAQGGHNKY